MLNIGINIVTDSTIILSPYQLIMKPNIGISSPNLAAVNNLLTGVLADAVVLYTKTRKFHWNVSGNSFMELHKLFEKHYKKLEESIDEIAERMNKLGAKTPGTMSEFLKATSLKETPGKISCSKRDDQRITERPRNRNRSFAKGY
jgi:starvation-inducible DNA-binding protein